MPISIQPNKKKAETLEVKSSAGNKRESGSEVPKSRRDPTIQYADKTRYQNGPQSVAPVTTTSNRNNGNKGEILRSRITKQSVSPDKYHINNNLVV